MPPRRSSRAASASQTPNIETKPIKRKRGQTLEPHNVELEEPEDDDAEANMKPKKGKRGPSVIKPSRPPRQSSRVSNSERQPSMPAEEEDLEEKSLFDPPPMPVLSNIPPAIPEEPASPRSSRVSNSERQPSMPAAEEDLEEKSLFDPPPMPGPSNIPRAIPEEPAGPKSRLVIHKMVLINFKSYAGRQEIGPFHKSFSSIVGPNGSGKSNTIDALLFVFGYRASKMRQGKISELIHISASFPDLDECSVEVHFRDIIDLPGPDAFKVVPNSQLVVTRQAFKNNASRYAINERSSNYTEVQTLLKGRGIDLDHNRFLILQGEVESIAQMKPKAQTEHEDGLLEYLEDIIGTSKYKEPIDEALVETERLQEDRQTKINRLRHVEKEKVALEARKKEAEDYLRLKNDHTKALSRQYQWSLWQSLEREAKLTAQIEKLTKDLAEETEKNKDDVAHLTLLRQHYEEREKTYAEVQAAAALAVKDLAANERQEIALQERRKHADGKAKKYRKSLKEDGAARKTALYTIEDTTAKIKSEKRKHDEYEVSLGEEEKVLEGIQDSLKDKTQVFHDQIQAKQKELQPWTAQINTKQAEIDVATSERDALAKKAQALQAANKEARETFDALQEDLQTKVSRQDELKDEKRNIQNDIQVAQKKAKDAQASVQEWRGKAGTSRNKLNEAKANQSEDLSRSKVLKSLTHLKDGGKIDGFHGRLGNLGTIPDKYDIAITTACGGSLDNMVVDEVSEAQACIEHLRKNNVGRASFMVLKKLKSYGMDKIATPENVPRLFDLVTPNHESYAPAFFKAIGNTLVANDMDQANRIAFGRQRWRVVTLAGGVIETSGAMSGGGSQVSRGGMSSKKAVAISPQQLRTYEKDSEDAANRLQEATAKLQEAEMELERLSIRGPEIDMAYQKLSLDIENVKKRITEAEKRVKDLGSQNKPNTGDLARISKLEQEIAKANGALEKLKEQSSRIDQDIKGFEKKILDIGGSKLLSQKSKVDGIRLHINLANEEITKAEVAKSKAEKDAAKLEKAVNSNTKALEAIEKEIEELNEQIAGLVDYVAKLKDNVENAQNAAENSKEDLETLKVELDAKEEQIAAFRQREMTIKQSLSDKEKENKENDRAITYFQDSHDKLSLEDIDDDEEDEEGEEGGSKEQPVKDGDGIVEAEGDVKAEPETKPQVPRQTREGTPSTELHVYTIPELMKFKKDELVAETVYLEEQIKNARPDLTVLKEYKQREQEFFNRAKDLELITAERDAQKAKYDGLRKQRLDEFMSGFNLISLKLKEMYQMITLGGNAELELVDSLDPFSEGIIFSVMPPKKSWKNISNLSGGEKTLSSLALVFALHVFKPTPLYFMDEIDAALDFRNVSIVANYIKDRTKNAQFIIISLRNDMFELSHRLIGIYKTSNATRSISIDNHALQSAIPQHTLPQPPISQAQISHAQTTLSTA